MAGNSRSPLPPKAQEMLTDCLRRDMTPKQVQMRLNKSFGVRLSQDDIAVRKAHYEKITQTKLFCKRKGADIVRDFLEKARDGADVSDLETVLTNAVYLDLLRRYALESDDITFRDLLKLTSDFRKARVAAMKTGAKPEKALTAQNAMELIQAFEQALQDDESLKGAFEKQKECLLEMTKAFFETKEFDAAREDYETMQRLARNYERSKSADAAD